MKAKLTFLLKSKLLTSLSAEQLQQIKEGTI